jgi:UDP-N-acetylglucosamine--N-acetylmuramyl-(pentapeptide) pyrophosphoryl-undecaprenol N-acetylglucosamine transferase
MDDHQAGNARALGDAGAAVILPEKDFTETTLSAALGPLLQDGAKLAAMAAAAKHRVRPDAAKALADLVEQIAGAKKDAA